MSPELINKRVELHALLKEQWQTILELSFPAVNQFEYRSGLGTIAVYTQYKPDRSLYQIKLKWLTGQRKGKQLLSAEIDNLLLKLKSKKDIHLCTD
jgi:hypothetical protein